MTELHIPVLTRRSGQDKQWVSRCSCGSDGPPATNHADAETALAAAHHSREPSGCELCGKTTPTTHTPPQPWRTYQVLELGRRRWAYACRDKATCLQTRLANEASDIEGDAYLDATPSATHPLLSLRAERLDDLPTAIAAHHIASARAPHHWHEITSSASDQQALAAKVVALHAIQTEAENDQRVAIAAARRSGVTWAHLADLLDFESGPRLRDWYIDSYVTSYDTPWPRDNPPDDWQAALAGDPKE